MQDKSHKKRVKKEKKIKKEKKRSKRRANSEMEEVSHNREEYEEAIGTVTAELEQKTYAQMHFRPLAQDTALKMVSLIVDPIVLN